MNKISFQFALLALFSSLHAINPPRSGPFPIGFWEQMETQDIGVSYGDSGWVNKMAQWRNGDLRDAQLEFNLPVLLGKYSGATTYFTAQNFQNMLFDDNSTGTMSDYYDEISHGEFSVDGSAHGWYQSTYTMSEAKSNTKQYVSEIAQLADPDVDFSQFDNDGPDNVPNSGDDDGYVDGIAVVYSGCGAEWSPGNDNLWPHMSSLGSSYEYTTGDASANGGYVIVSSYFVSPELAGGGDCYTDIIRPMGVYAHEFGHILGLPDLYDRNDGNGDSEGIGNWCLMAGGSWNGWAGDTPAHMSAWCKQEMGWVDPVVLNAGQTGLSIPEAENNAYALKIWEDDYQWSRYFLVENRQLTGYDAGLPGSGLMVYHVDENKRYGSHRWSSGSVNDDHLHKLVDVEAADGDADMDNNLNRGDDGDPYPGSSNNIDFSSNSNPNSNRYSGEATDIVVTNISSSSSTMSADISLEPRRGIPIVYDHAGMSGSGWGYSSPQDSWGGVVFEYPSTEEQDGYLTEVDIGLRYDNSSYEIKVYDSFDGTTLGNQLYHVSGTSANRGWKSIPIDSVLIQPGQEFFVTHKIVDQAYAISFDKLTAPTGRSYFSGNGTSYSTTIGESYNINLRAKLHNHIPDLDLSGCTDPYAENYDPDATVDDGSCAGYPDNGNYALSFDGVDDHTHMDWGSNMSTYTVSLWVRSNVESQELYRGFFNSYDNQNYGFQLDCNGSNQYRFISELGSVVFAPLSIEWSHIAIVANNSTTSFYFNGDLVTTVDWVMDEWNQMELGRNRSTQQPGNYTVDQVSVWDIARSANEIQEEMTSGLNSDEDGLLVHWKGNAGEGELLYDHSGNANHAAIHGATFVDNTPIWASIEVDPDSMYQYLIVGDSATQTLTIHNEGDADLDWEIDLADALGRFTMMGENASFQHSVINRNRPSNEGPGAPNSSEISVRPFLGRDPGGRDGDINMLLLSNNTGNSNTFANEILPEMENVEFSTWDASTTPELDYLEQFDLVMLYENGTFSNSGNVGDVLSEYVLNGGNLMLSTFYWQDRSDGGYGGNWGALESIDPLYDGSCDYASGTLGTIIDHPLTESVNSLQVGSFRGGPVTLRDNATAVAWWSDGDPLIVYNQPGGTITAVTMGPAWVGSGDWHQVWTNAINWTANAGPDWLSTDVVAGTIAPGASQQVTVSFIATDVDTGDYHAQLEISSNDPDQSIVSIPVHLDVDMLFPDIDVSPDSLDEELYVGESSTQILTVYNNGEADLDWYSAIFDDVNDRGRTSGNQFLLSEVSGIGSNLSVEEAISSINARSRTSPRSMSDNGGMPVIRAEDGLSGSRNGPVAGTILSERNERSLDAMVLFADHDDWAMDVINKLIDTEQFNSVSYVNVRFDTPTLEELSAFGSVFVWSDYGFGNATELGNNLADYVDAGGGVVCAMFTVGQVELEGRFYTEDYWAIDPISSTTGNSSIGTIHDEDHPILNNVESLEGCGSCYRPTGGLSDGATMVAEWMDGRPMVATKDMNGVHRADLGLFPPTTDAFSAGWDPDSDVILLMANALTWVSGQTQTDWLSYSPEAGVIPPGSSQDIEVQFSAVDIEEGTYSTDIQILSNDEDQPELLIPVELIANIPYPNIVLETDQMDVNLFLGDSATRSIVIGNDGVADLNWSVDILDYGRDGTFYSFNNCGGEGHQGPSQEDCDGEYDSTTLQGSVTVNEGIQQWTVPQSGEYTIEVFGAQGGGETNAGLAGGLGARMGGTFYLEEGEILQVLIGQMGIAESQYSGGYAGGGGGGSFVTRGTHDSDESILIVAGGGGGSGTHDQGYDAIIETYGSTSTGSAGQGGVPGSNGNSGAGFFGNGLFGGHNGATISYSYVNGGMGGIGYSGGGTGYGGFGGGAGDGYADGGGGGGYSGGNGWENLAGGSGGASYNSGDEQDNEAGVNSGHGQVVITLDSPTITWISTSQDSGVVSVGETDTLHVHFNASELEEGEYFADLNLLSDDPDDPDISLPTSLMVFEQVMLADIPDTSVHEDGMLELTIDVDYPGYEHELTVTSDTSGIEVSVIGDTIGLMPITDWTGVASMEVILTIENSLSDTVEFQLDVTAVNDPPNAIDHWYYINEDSSLVAYLPANDGDSLNGEHDDQSLTFTSMSSFEHGSFDLGREDGLLTYEPYMNYFGPDSMEYLLMDDGMTNGQYDALMDTGLIVINIMPVNDDPVLADLVDTTMHEDSNLMITISASDVDNDTLTVDVSFSIDEYVTGYIEDTTLYINSHFNWSGTVDVTVLASDNMGRAVDVEQFLLTVLPVNDPPEFGQLHALVGVGMDFELPIIVSDIDTDSLSVSLDPTWTYPEWVIFEDGPFRLMGNAPDEGDHHLPLLVDDGEFVVSDTFHLESRYFQPRITSVMDVPDDEGGRVYVEFERSFFDHVDATNQFYTIFRLDEMNDSTTWVSVVTGAAGGDESYVYEVSTVMDSTVEDDGVTEFMVIAYMNEGTFPSGAASGYSLDNLAPDAPTGLVATVVDEGIHLSWDLSSADDFQYFELEKSIMEDFSSVETFTLVDTSYLDAIYELNQTNFYRLSAVDNSGNVSDYSDMVEAAILQLEEDLVPDSYALHQNYPNPFNPVTTIRYDLPEEAQVMIRIFDIQGRIVRTLVDGHEDAGRKAVPWNATNQVGEPVAAGMYIYMIQSGGFSQVRKMLLLK